MRRKNPVSLRVDAPSRGLITRLPPELADLFRGDKKRCCTVARNVRFDDGCISNAPGYSTVRLDVENVLDALLVHYKLDEAEGTRFDQHTGQWNLLLTDMGVTNTVSIDQSLGKLANAVQFSNGQPTQQQYKLRSREADSANGEVSPFEDITAGNFSVAFWYKPSSISTGGTYNFLEISSNGILAGQADDTIVFFVGPSATTVAASGLVAGQWHFITLTYDGVDLKTYVNGVFSSDIAFSLTACASDRLDLLTDPSLPTFSVDSLSVWARDLTTGEITQLYNTGDGFDYPFQTGAFTLLHQANLSVGGGQPLLAAAGSLLFYMDRGFEATTQTFTVSLEELYSGDDVDPDFPWKATDFYDKVIFAQHDNLPQYWIGPSGTATRALPGLPNSEDEWDGVEVFQNHVVLWKDDKLKWSDLDDFTNFIPIGTTIASVVLTIDSPGFTQPALGGSVVIPTVEDPAAEGLVTGQYIRIDDDRGVDGVFYNFYLVTALGANSVTATLQDLTGATTPALTVADGQEIFTLDANEAGETRLAGSKKNGPIFDVISMGDYAYVFKERSISSMQYVGVGSGIFFIHTEVSNEGLISRTAALNMGDGRIAFLGHKELYTYAGGPSPVPVCRQYTRTLFKELDRTRLGEIRLYHYEEKNELWVAYPVVGGFKVLVWNYFEDTATTDIYDSDIQGFTALESVDWSTDPAWDSLSADQTWENFSQTTSWDDLEDAGVARLSLIATGTGELLIFGTQFSRDGDAYTATAETQDYDLGDGDVWKYVDVVKLGLQVTSPDTQTRTLYVQVGTRASMDQDITWTARQAVEVQGNGTPPTKINPGGSGRYIRLRFESEDTDVQWRVSSFEVHCRAGSTY